MTLIEMQDLLDSLTPGTPEYQEAQDDIDERLWEKASGALEGM